MNNNQAIGIFDSGIGGLTVMKELMEKLPQEKLIYFGDTARVPYGDKSPETILRYSIENAIFLLEHKIKLLVIACNTASAYAFDKLRHILKIPIVDVIIPGAEQATRVSKNKKIGILATRATTLSGAYPRAIHQKFPDIETYSIACPLLVPLIEEQFLDHLATQMIIKEYVTPLKEKNIDTLLLGCTHYPLLKSHIQREIGLDVSIIDSANSCAEQVSSILNTHSLSNTSHETYPSYQYYVSDDPEKFRLHGAKFLNHAIEKVETSFKMKFEI